jgi:DNA-binding transcriptional MerR regulator
LSLVSIGEFARLSRLSSKALRLYDELGLLVPAEVDAETGYRWYADTQLERARVVASLRRIRVPLARIRDMLALDPATAAEEVRAYWAGAEAEHAAQRVLVGHLVDRLHGKNSAMYEVTVRDIPTRSLLSLMRRVHEDDLIPMGGGGTQAELANRGPVRLGVGAASPAVRGACAACWSSTLPTREPDRTPNSPCRCAEPRRDASAPTPDQPSKDVQSRPRKSATEGHRGRVDLAIWVENLQGDRA